MKKIVFISIALLTGLFCLASCQEELPSGPRPGVMIVSMDAGTDFIEFRMGTSDADEAAYLVMESVEESDRPTAERAFSEGKPVSAEENTYRVDGLQPETEYDVYAVARRGEQYSDVKSLKMVTLPEKEMCGFSMSLIDKASHRLKVRVIPTDDRIEYAFYLYPSDVIRDRQLEDDDRLHEFLMDDLTKKFPSLSMSELMDRFLIKGTFDEWLTDLYENTEYCLFAYAMSRDGKRLTSIERFNARTAKKKFLEMDFNIEVSNIRPFSVDLTVDPDLSGEKYAIACFSETEYPELQDADALAEAFVAKNQYELDMGLGLLRGTQVQQGYAVFPETDYRIVAFAYDKEIVSRPVMYRFASGKLGDMESVTYETRLNDIDGNNVEVEIKPSSGDVFYFAGLMPTEEADEEGVSDFVEGACSSLKNDYNNEKYFNDQLSLSAFLTANCFHGNREVSFYNLQYGTDYSLVIFGVDAEGNASRNYHLEKSFAVIPEAEISDAEFTAELYKVFNSTDAFEAGVFTDIHEDEMDLPIIAVRFHANSKAKELYYTVFNDSYTGTDEEVIDIAYWTPFESIAMFPYGVFMLNKWDSDYYVFTVAKDVAGNLGKVSRLTLRVGKDDVSPVSELEDLLSQK